MIAREKKVDWQINNFTCRLVSTRHFPETQSELLSLLTTSNKPHNLTDKEILNYLINTGSYFDVTPANQLLGCYKIDIHTKNDFALAKAIRCNHTDWTKHLIDLGANIKDALDLVINRPHPPDAFDYAFNLRSLHEILRSSNLPESKYARYYRNQYCISAVNAGSLTSFSDLDTFYSRSQRPKNAQNVSIRL